MSPRRPALRCRALAWSPSRRTHRPRLLENLSLGRVLSPIFACVHSMGALGCSPPREDPQGKERVRRSLLSGLHGLGWGGAVVE